MYTAVTGGLFIWSISLLIWAIRVQVPSTSPYPLIDFGARVAAGEEVGQGIGDELKRISSGLDVKPALQGKGVYLKKITRERIGEGNEEKEDLLGFANRLEGNV